jgi:predicted PurR-regulated permease PerM
MRNSPLVKITTLLLFICLFFTCMYYARDFLIPVVFAILLSMLLLPLCRKFEKWGINRILSIIICLLIVLIVISGIIYLFYTQVANFVSDIELIKEQLTDKLHSIQAFIQTKTNISAKEQMTWVEERYSMLAESSAGFIKSFVMGLTGTIIALGLILIYIFFFLLYRERFKKFILQLFSEAHHEKVDNVINRTKDLILHYLTGLLIALTILGVMNSIGLLALGIRQAIFLGFLAGFLNIIPYVGTVVGSLFPVMMALLFKDSIWYAVGVGAIFLFNQFIDNNITTPNVVGSHVQVNPLATIMAILVGGAVWGVGGMILFIPLIGVFKIICDNVDDLKPIGYLLGEDDDLEKKESGLYKRFKRVMMKKSEGGNTQK